MKKKKFFVVLLNLSWGKRWEQFLFLPSGGSTLLTKAEKQQQKAKQKIKTEPSSGEQNKKKPNRSFLHSSLKLCFPNTELYKVRETGI